MREGVSMEHRVTIAVLAALCAVMISGPAGSAPAVSNVTASGSVGRYQILTVDFNVSTTASNPHWPYDAAPPASIPAGAGVTVDGLFSRDNWATTVTVPAFYYQDYTRQLITGTGAMYTDEAVVPVGSPHWRIRFAPAELGDWQFRIRVTDSSGTTTAVDDANWRFACVASDSSGFVRVSPTDSRYFEFSDGTPLLGPGVNAHFVSTYRADSLLQTYGLCGVKIVRWWMNYREWQNPFGGGTEVGCGPQWANALALAALGGRKAGDRYCAVVDRNNRSNTYQFAYLTARTMYRLSGYVKTNAVVGDPGKGVWAYIGGTKSTPIQGTHDWAKFTIDITPLNTSAVAVGFRHDGTSGTGYFDDLSLQASTDGGQTWSSDHLSKSDFDYQNYVDPREAWKVDHIFETARQNGVYLKTVISEVGDATLGCIGPDGASVPYSDSNFYASATHPSRWLQKAWWRCLTARWGAYSSRHSWELCNEGNPFSEAHWGAANDMANYVHALDPNRALCTTSFWHSTPMNFWNSSSCDYLDTHEYIGRVYWSHGPRIYAWMDDLTTLPYTTVDGTLTLDTTTAHTGGKSIKLSPVTTTIPTNYQYSPAGNVPYQFRAGINPTHTYTLRFWAKAQNVSNPGGVAHWTRPGVRLVWSEAYYENDHLSEMTSSAELGTYDWRQYTTQHIVPPVGANTANLGPVCTKPLSGVSHFWVDDIEFIDETTGEKLMVDGGFEGDPIHYDTALAARKYGTLLCSFGGRVQKPAVWGETGIVGPKELGDTYKGYIYTNEDQRLVDDTQVLHLKKMIWAHAGSGNPNMLYWWTENVSKKNKWNYFGAFQDFMQGIPVSNGHYVDAGATTSVPALRAWGQKDLTNNRAHLWIDNAPYTWKNIQDGVTVPAISGTVTVPGLANGKYRVEWWNTSAGAIGTSEELTCTEGSLTLSVSSLQSDIACKVIPVEARVEIGLTVPSTSVTPGQTVTITLHYTNTGGTQSRNVTVSAQVPALMTYVAGSAEATGGVHNPATGLVSWTIDSVAAHESGTRTFQAKVQQPD